MEKIPKMPATVDANSVVPPSPALARLARAGELICAAILVGAALLKVLSVAWDQPILQRMDPIIPLRNQTVLLSVSVVEVLVALRVLLSRSSFEKCALLAWMALGFSVYRLGLWAKGVREPCACLGDGLGWWPWLADHKAAVSATVFWAFVALTAVRVLLALRISASDLVEKKTTNPTTT